MLKRIPPSVFWLALIVVVFGLGYRLFAAMQPEETALEPSHVGLARTPHSQDSPAATHGAANLPSRPLATQSAARRPAAPRPSEAQPAGHAGEALALAQHNTAFSATRSAPAGDFTYSGGWEHITGHYDGRTSGSSSRSFHPGSRAMLTFNGRAVRLYGVVGPGGGLGSIDIDGHVKRIVDFYSATKSVHKLVFTSPALPAGTHHLTLSVILDQALPVERSHYVNFDGAEIGS